jgi:transcriptional regulator with XRE-family HTH domain
MTTTHGGSLLRRRLGHELRRLRERAGKTHVEIAEKLECSQTKISKIESGRVGIRTLELKLLLELFQVPEEQAAPLLQMARGSHERGMWHRYGDALTPRFAGYAALEAEAAEIRAYQAEVVPGLLQTEDYANAINAATRLPRAVDVRRYTEVRMVRQRRVRDGDVTLTAIVDEAVIRRIVGGQSVLRQQLRQLIESSRRPNITLRVLPFSAGEHPAMTGPFEIARFADRELDPDVVYLENQTGGMFVDDKTETQRYDRCFEQLLGKSLDEDRSVELIGDAISELRAMSTVQVAGH